METIDSLFIDKIFQPLSHKFQIWTGKTNFFLAYIFFYFGVFSSISSVLLLLFLSPNKIIEMVPLLIVSIVETYLFLSCANWAKERDEYFKTSNKSTMNSSRLQHILVRMALLFGVTLYSFLLIYSTKLAIGVKVMLTGLDFTFMILSTALYFFACTPMPKGESKVGEFVKSLKAGFLKTSSHRI